MCNKKYFEITDLFKLLITMFIQQIVRLTFSKNISTNSSVPPKICFQMTDFEEVRGKQNVLENIKLLENYKSLKLNDDVATFWRNDDVAAFKCLLHQIYNKNKHWKSYNGMDWVYSRAIPKGRKNKPLRAKFYLHFLRVKVRKSWQKTRFVLQALMEL